MKKKALVEDTAQRYFPAVLRTITDPELVKYYQHVSEMFRSESTDLISNSSVEHAQILIETMVSRARETITIFCEELKSEVYDEPSLIDELKEAATRGVKIRIAVQNSPVCRKFLSALQHFPAGTTEVMLCNEGTKAKSADFNFLVVDAKSFRFEKDLKRHEATASANSPDLAGQMLSYFRAIEADSSAIPLN